MKFKHLAIIYTFIVLIMAVGIKINAQSKVFQTFKDTRVINSHSTETLKAGKMDIRIGHRFGDLAGEAGGWPSFYGLESAQDIMTGVEYGVNNGLTVGVTRYKGSGPLKQNVNGMAKVKILEQDLNGKNSFSLAMVGITTFSTMAKSETEGVLNYFAKTNHRLSYHLEMIMARKFGNRFSLQLSSAITHRNIVSSSEENSTISLGAASRIQMTKAMGLIFDIKKPFLPNKNGFQHWPAGVGFEWETGGGHVFQLNVTNATGLNETDYIPYTNSDWTKGQFRLGFTISRLFTI